MVGRMNGDLINQALEGLGALLSFRGQRFEIVVIGGANLIYSGLVSRTTTRDVAVLGEVKAGRIVKLRPMPPILEQAIIAVGRQFNLPADWINLGPDILLDKGLPRGFADRLERESFGGLVVWFAGRIDLVALKLYAAANPNTNDPSASRHAQDLRDLKPTAGEIGFGRDWIAGWARADLLLAVDAIIASLRR